MVSALVPVLFAYTVSFAVFAQQPPRTMVCSTQNGFEITINTQGRESGRVNLNHDFFELTGEEFVKLELEANVFCDNIEVRSLEYSRDQGVLTFLCLKPGDTFYYDLPMTCEE